MEQIITLKDPYTFMGQKEFIVDCVGKDFAYIEVDGTIHSIPVEHIESHKYHIKGVFPGEGSRSLQNAIEKAVEVGIFNKTFDGLKSSIGTVYEGIYDTLNKAAEKIVEQAKNTTPTRGIIAGSISTNKFIKSGIKIPPMSPPSIIPHSWEEDPRTLAMVRDNDKYIAENKALRNRAKAKGKSNVRLNEQNHKLLQEIQELKFELDMQIKDRNEFKKRNDEYIEQLNEADRVILDQKNKLKRFKRGAVQEFGKIMDKLNEI